MQYHEFIGQVQHRARLGTLEEAVSATRATLEVLGERISGGQAENLAAELPQEIGIYLKQTAYQFDRFDADEFFARVSRREGADLPDAVHHARVVIDVLRDAVSQGAIDDLLSQLPPDYQPLFTSGSEGEMT